MASLSRQTGSEEANVTVLCATPRLLSVTVQIGQWKIGIVSGHCPHANKVSERNEFLKLLAEQLAGLKQAHLLLCGVDLNGRLPCPYKPACGDLVFEDPDQTGHATAQIMVEQGL